MTHILLLKSAGYKESNQGDTTLHIPGCSALLIKSLGEADLSENCQCCRKTGETLFFTTFNMTFFNRMVEELIPGIEYFHSSKSRVGKIKIN